MPQSLNFKSGATKFCRGGNWPEASPTPGRPRCAPWLRETWGLQPPPAHGDTFPPCLRRLALKFSGKTNVRSPARAVTDPSVQPPRRLRSPSGGDTVPSVSQLNRLQILWPKSALRTTEKGASEHWLGGGGRCQPPSSLRPGFRPHRLCIQEAGLSSLRLLHPGPRGRDFVTRRVTSPSAAPRTVLVSALRLPRGARPLSPESQRAAPRGTRSTPA